ncbi:hypothetical protein WOLCODRAFT_162614 [Wolfiporia cocos MD-104 SS10]|uniref:Uncharacterized protein n=1 Tax=Wolfiporia cocos (strain MD-104) TaxID=742152 RepID=A0A2H3JSV7_WOLCO|nr:hypothetical protein WOLCODRAFT_162614 [Wolfiporia cocos MD-104 SS10]
MQQGCNASTTRYKRLDQVKSHVRGVHKKDPKLFNYFKLFSNDTTSAPSPAVPPTVKRPAKRTKAARSAASNTVRCEATSSTTPAPAPTAVRAAASTSASSSRSRHSPDAHVPCPDSPPPTGYQYATPASYSDDARSCQRTNSFSDASSQYSDVSSQYSDASPQYGYHYSGVPHHAFYSGPASTPMYVPGGSYPSTSYYADTGVRPYASPQRGGLTGSFGALPEQSYPELDPMHEFIDPVLLDIDQLQRYQLYQIDNSESAQHQDPRILLNPPVPELSPSSSQCHTQSSAAPSPLVIPGALIPSSSKVDIPRYQRDLVWSDIYDRDDVSPTSGFFGRLS